MAILQKTASVRVSSIQIMQKTRAKVIGKVDTMKTYQVSFSLEKIKEKLLERSAAASRRNLGGTNLGLRRSCSAGESSLWEGEIIVIVITNDPLIERGSISTNIFTSTISSQTLVHLFYPIFVSKPQIGTCGLLAVLITPFRSC